MTVLQDIEWETCLLEPTRDPALEQFVRQEMGGVPPMVPYFEVCPWLVRSLMAINQYRVRLVHVSFALADLIGLVVSQENSCRFCYATQRVLLRAQGLPPRDSPRRGAARKPPLLDSRGLLSAPTGR